MEEDIEYLEQFIGIKKEYKYKPIKAKTLNNTRQAIENLIARNKELEKENEKIRKSNKTLFELTQHTAMQEFINQDYIPKSKVEEEIEKLQNEIKEKRSIASRTADRVVARILNDQINELYKTIKILKELLQEGDK